MTEEKKTEILKRIGDNNNLPQKPVLVSLDSNLSAKAFTTGLGLPLARKIVQAHHGRIELDVRKERENAVTVFLPSP